MALDINNYLPDIFKYLCETARLHLVYCIPRLMSSKPTPKAHVSWTDTNITWLISFLYEHWTEGTDGGFKKSTYVAAAEDLAPQRRREKLGELQMAMDKGKIQFIIGLLANVAVDSSKIGTDSSLPIGIYLDLSGIQTLMELCTQRPWKSRFFLHTARSSVMRFVLVFFFTVHHNSFMIGWQGS